MICVCVLITKESGAKAPLFLLITFARVYCFFRSYLYICIVTKIKEKHERKFTKQIRGYYNQEIRSRF